MSEQRGVTVFVPALNEEENLPSTIQSVFAAAKAAGNAPIEIIIVNDGSTDGTAAVIQDLEKKYDVIRSLHHPRNTGAGASFQDALKIARYPKIALYPGDGMVSSVTLRDMIANAYKADFVCAFTTNNESRTKFRTLLSLLYTLIYKNTFHIPLVYINATPVYPVDLLRGMKIRSRRYSFAAEVTVKVLRSGCRFLEIPGFLNAGNMSSSAVRIQNLIEVVICYVRLIFEIYVGSRQRYAHTPIRVLPPLTPLE